MPTINTNRPRSPSSAIKARANAVTATPTPEMANGLDMALIEPGKPWQNGTNESFNGKFRDECLSMEWFRSRKEAVPVIESWRCHYNVVRPHSSLGNLTPDEFRLTCGDAATPEAILQ